MIELLPLLLQGAWVTVKVTFFGSLLAIACATDRPAETLTLDQAIRRGQAALAD